MAKQVSRVAPKALIIVFLFAFSVWVDQKAPAVAAPCRAATIEYYSNSDCTGYTGVKWMSLFNG